MTLTDGAVYYRFKTEFYTYINRKINNLTTPTPLASNLSQTRSTNPTTPTITAKSLKNPPLPSHVDVKVDDAPEDESLATPTVETTQKSPPEIHDIVQNMEKQLDDEVESIKHDFVPTSPIQQEHIQQLEQEIHALQTKLTSLQNDQKNQWTTFIGESKQQMEKLDANTKQKLQDQQEAYTISTNKLQGKLTYITKQVEITEKKVKNADALIEKSIETHVQKYMTKISEQIHNMVETAEHDVTATMLSFHHHVKKQKQSLSPRNTSTDRHKSTDTIDSNDTANTQELQALFRKYREKLRLMEQRIDKWDYASADRDLDTLLVAKLNDFDASTEKTFNELDTAKENMITLAKKLRKTIKKKHKQYAPTYLLPQHHHHRQRTVSAQSVASLSSIESSSDDDDGHEATTGKNNEKIFSTGNSKYHVRQKAAHTTPPVSHARTDENTHRRRQYAPYDRSPENNTVHTRHDTTLRVEPRINTDYLRKNIKISCSDDSHLLEFYRKLRLCVQKGGIFLAQLEDLDPDIPIYDRSQVPPHDVNIQSNALYTLLTNEEIITSDYTQAQNCLSARNDTMDGFGALKSMLTTVHPNFTKKSPPHNPPALNNSDNLHTYEQHLRNYFLLHYLYSGYMPTEVQKSEQYLRGIDNDAYNQAKQRIITQKDSVNVYGTELPEKFMLENITGTLMNLTERQPTINTLNVNALHTRAHNNNNGRPNRNTQYNKSNDSNKSRPWKKPLSNVQCHACKVFGHRSSECNIVGKVLAVMDLKSKNDKICKTILQSHIEKNSPQKRLAIIKTLQSTNMLPDDEPAETYILDADLQNTITHTINATNCSVPDTALYSDNSSSQE